MMRALKLAFYVLVLAITSCSATGGEWVFTLRDQDELVQKASVSVCDFSYPLRRTDGRWFVRVQGRCEGTASMRIERTDRSVSLCDAGYVTKGFRQTHYVIGVSAQGCRLLSAEAA